MQGETPVWAMTAQERQSYYEAQARVIDAGLRRLDRPAKKHVDVLFWMLITLYAAFVAVALIKTL